MSNVKLDKREAASYRHAYVHACVRVCPCTLLSCETPGGKRYLMQGRGAVREGQEGQKHKAPGALPLSQRADHSECT